LTFSPRARPPIQPLEAQVADTAICRHHKGLITITGDRDGSVWYCPIGKQYWRYSKEQSSFTAPLTYPKAGVV
jgi:hypothetical protein